MAGGPLVVTQQSFPCTPIAVTFLPAADSFVAVAGVNPSNTDVPYVKERPLGMSASSLRQILRKETRKTKEGPRRRKNVQTEARTSPLERRDEIPDLDLGNGFLDV